MYIKPGLNIQEQIERGIDILKQGGLVAYPTDTVYGLGACAGIPKAVEEIYKVKERPRNMPLPLLLADVSQITEIASPVPAIAWSLIESFLPGALTLVLYKSRLISEILKDIEATIAIRVPSHPVPIALIKGLGTPIIGTSANLSGRPSPLTAEEVYSQLGDRIDLIIDGGQRPGGKESTVVDVTGTEPVLLREGAISAGKIEKACGCNILRRV